MRIYIYIYILEQSLYTTCIASKVCEGDKILNLMFQEGEDGFLATIINIREHDGRHVNSHSNIISNIYVYNSDNLFVIYIYIYPGI